MLYLNTRYLLLHAIHNFTNKTPVFNKTNRPILFLQLNIYGKDGLNISVIAPMTNERFICGSMAIGFLTNFLLITYSETPLLVFQYLLLPLWYVMTDFSAGYEDFKNIQCARVFTAHNLNYNKIVFPQYKLKMFTLNMVLTKWHGIKWDYQLECSWKHRV